HNPLCQNLASSLIPRSENGSLQGSSTLCTLCYSIDSLLRIASFASSAIYFSGPLFFIGGDHPIAPPCGLHSIKNPRFALHSLIQPHLQIHVSNPRFPPQFFGQEDSNRLYSPQNEIQNLTTSYLHLLTQFA